MSQNAKEKSEDGLKLGKRSITMKGNTLPAFWSYSN